MKEDPAQHVPDTTTVSLIDRSGEGLQRFPASQSILIHMIRNDKPCQTEVVFSYTHAHIKITHPLEPNPKGCIKL